MTETMREFLEKVSSDDVLYEKMEVLKKETDKEKVISETIKIAKEDGVTLCTEDFELQEGEIDEAELAAVAGGWTKCGCFTLGGGNEDQDGTICPCIGSGLGMRKDNFHKRCLCIAYGYGYNCDISDDE
ncbi:MAG: ferredoxin-thioredoxin reductase catalytic domain-containing protein [Lachnospiraceae bacterium]